MPSAPGSLLARVRLPHVFPLLLGLIFVCGLLTYAIPSGTYDRQQVQVGESTRTVLVPGTYRQLPKDISALGVLVGRSQPGAATPTSVVGFLTAVPRGMESAADIIFLILVVGGVFGILQQTGTVAAVLHALLRRFAHSRFLLTGIIVTVVAAGGSTLGMGEELIPLVPLFLLAAREMGYDRIFGLALVYVASQVGFAAATTNPFTVQVAQGIAGVPPGSGIPFRLVFFACAVAMTVAYLLWYGERVRRNPASSFMAGVEDPADAQPLPEVPLSSAHLWIVATAAVIFAATLYAIQVHGWWLAEMSGGFLLTGIVAAALARLSVADATRGFVRGVEEIVVAALVVGFAKGIQVVLDDARVLDTLIHSAATVLQTFPPVVGALGMLVFQTTLNFFIPSGSGQAAVTMPLMAPLADVLGLTRQTAIFAFTCGDGFSNMVIPTSAILMASLGIAGVPFERWLRFMGPLFLLLFGLSAAFLGVAVWIEY
jgi:uncharacterized ion transporter superfamily protein YfcC